MQSGDKVCNLSIATSERWKDRNGERKERTEWHRVVIFSQPLVKIAEQYLRKGAKVYIEGQIETRKWQDQNGQDKYSTEVVMRPYKSELNMLDGRSGGGDFNAAPSNYDSGPAAQPAASNPAPVDDLEDEIPF